MAVGIAVITDHMRFACLHLYGILSSVILPAVVGAAAELD